MLKIIGYLLGLVVVAAAVILVFALTKPDSFHVERMASIKAPPEKIFPLINDFNNWPKWSPWEKRDATMKKTLSGAASGVGAVYDWDGNSDVGAGRMEISESTPSQKIAIKLDFKRPMAASNVATFTLTPHGDATDVTWAMDGPSPYVAKVMDVIFGFDKMIGGDFQQGLDALKAEAEKP
mgnify:CR=1 FL=1|jgi:uncharacterized protein YndB with AHSA1/START domain